mmetsp:Transcript_7868/g.11876  ORF Transcript_7868/g.11876 Transcript_7868/m.11876 type:complete len:225 (-) Transcript_7868:592-1266(-)
MFIDSRVNFVIQPRRDQHSWHADTKLFKIKRNIVGGNPGSTPVYLWSWDFDSVWHNAIPIPAMFIISNNKKSVIPGCRLTNSIVNLGNKIISPSNGGRRVIGTSWVLTLRTKMRYNKRIRQLFFCSNISKEFIKGFHSFSVLLYPGKIFCQVERILIKPCILFIYFPCGMKFNYVDVIGIVVVVVTVVIVIVVVVVVVWLMSGVGDVSLVKNFEDREEGDGRRE